MATEKLARHKSKVKPPTHYIVGSRTTYTNIIKQDSTQDLVLLLDHKFTSTSIARQLFVFRYEIIRRFFKNRNFCRKISQKYLNL